MNKKEILKKKNLTGINKAAILLLSLQKEEATKIIAKLNKSEINKIVKTISELENIDTTLIHSVYQEFIQDIQNSTKIMGNKEELSNIILDNMDQKEINKIKKDINFSQSDNLIAQIEQRSPIELAALLQKEDSKISTLILNELHIQYTSQVLEYMNEEYVAKLIINLAHIKNINPQIKNNIKEIINNKILPQLNHPKNTYHNKLQTLMEYLSSEKEQQVIDKIDEIDKEVSQMLRSSIIKFSDILYIEEQDINILLQNVDYAEMLIALVHSDQEIIDRVLQSLPKAQRLTLSEELDIRKSESKAKSIRFQSKIAKKIKELKSQGIITIEAD